MDTLNTYRGIVEEVLKNYVNVSYANAEIKNEIIFDRINDRYTVISVGWEDVRRIHGCLVHIDIIGEKVWIQRDETETGLPQIWRMRESKEHIVLGFHEPDARKYTDYAEA
ncbi:MAG: XisI protein [Desulfobacterales bacterium]